MSVAGREPQVSWKALTEDADVVASNGSSVGKVSRVVGDADADIFTGIAVRRHAFAGEQLVPAEAVRGIWVDRVEVALTPDEVEGLPAYEDEPAVQVRPGGGGWLARLFGRRG